MDLLDHFNWTYVSVIISDDSYGRFAYSDLLTKVDYFSILKGKL